MKRLLSPLLPVCLLLSCFSVLADGAESRAPAGDNNATDGAHTSSSTDDHAADSESPATVGTPERHKIGAQPTSIAILSEPDGLKTLNIHFRWSLFTEPSIEVRLVPGPEAKGVDVAPVYFHEHLKGRVREEFFHCLDNTDNGKTYSFTRDKIVYNMIGRRNSLGNQGVHVQVSSETPKKSDLPAVAYLQLDTWAVDNGTLSLDLARDEFAESGTLFVWFFRGDKVIWQERLRWPGYK